MKILERRLLKGGSLAGTYVITTSSGQYVRKEISLVENREYGYQRWYSQLKRLQRYHTLFPDLFVKVEGYGLDNGLAYFDMPYYENAVNCYEYLKKCKDDDKIINLKRLIINGMETIHNLKVESDVNALKLYYKEEVEKKLIDSCYDLEFNEFYNYDTIVFNGKKIKSFKYLQDDYRDLGQKYYIEPIESYTHGNITLENIIYDESQNKILFIDPYEENIIDNKFNEYSQILQSCNSNYEQYNELDIKDYENVELTVPYGIERFNWLFCDFLTENLKPWEIKVVKYFEISQFIRMLPFKLQVSRDKMFLFYSLASYLTNELLESE